MKSSIDLDRLSDRVNGWGAMRFFPRTDSAVDVAARLEICKAVASMAGTWDRACWIIDQMLVLTSDWPGLEEVRGVFCHRFAPADGITAESALCAAGHIPDNRAVGFKPRQPVLDSARDPRDRSLPAGFVGETVKRLTGKRA